MFHTPDLLRPVIFSPARDRAMLPFNKITQMFPLIYENNLSFKAGRGFPYYHGPQPVDPDNHPAPNISRYMVTASRIPFYSPLDQQLCPSLIQKTTLRPTEQFVGPRVGVYFPRFGWVRQGTSWRLGKGYITKYKRKRYNYLGKWLEVNMTPRWKVAPRIGASGPGARWRGRLMYTNLPIKKLLWAFENGSLNPNERITLFHLVEAKVLAPWEVIWPGVKLVAEELDTLQIPIHIEMQQATSKAIELIEKAGGSFTCTYMSPQGMYDELFPEEFPMFHDQHLPDRLAFESASANPKKRGYLTKWLNESSQFANPSSGRRYSHYVEPPTGRDFPSSMQEHDRVRHHQKWHLGQPGTGTVLPWLSDRSNTRPFCSDDDYHVDAE